MDAHSDITFGLCKIDSVSDADLSWKESAVVPVRVREKKWPWRRIISISMMLPLKAAVWYFKFYVFGWSCPHTCFQLVTSNPHNLISNKNSKPSALINFNTQWCLIYYLYIYTHQHTSAILSNYSLYNWWQCSPSMSSIEQIQPWISETVNA